MKKSEMRRQRQRVAAGSAGLSGSRSFLCRTNGWVKGTKRRRRI